MPLRALRLRGPLVLVLTCLLCPTAALPVPQDAFTEREASQLLNQIAGALAAHNQKKMLDAFDLNKMTDGARFRQQINSFFAQTGIIRAHFNLLHAGPEDGKSVATADFEMEAGLRDDSLPPVRKQAQLRLVAERSADGWKFTDIEPRSFFSTQP